MCLVIDTNVLAAVFNSTCSDHHKFKDIKEWLDSGKGTIVFGGTKYKDELKKALSYMRLINSLKDNGQALSIDDALVDAYEKKILELTRGMDCDDQHIISLLAVSNSGIVCSLDSRAYVFFKERTYYPKGNIRVRIYTSSRNKRLLENADCKKLRNFVV